MIFGLPWTAWLLLLAAIGAGLVVELTFFLRHQRADRHPTPHDPTSR